MVLLSAFLSLLLGGYWIYHKGRVDIASLYSNPEEKLWYVVKNY